MSREEQLKAWELTRAQWIRDDEADPRTEKDLVIDFARELAAIAIAPYKEQIENNNRLLYMLHDMVEEGYQAQINELTQTNKNLLS